MSGLGLSVDTWIETLDRIMVEELFRQGHDILSDRERYTLLLDYVTENIETLNARWEEDATYLPPLEDIIAHQPHLPKLVPKDTLQPRDKERVRKATAGVRFDPEVQVRVWDRDDGSQPFQATRYHDMRRQLGYPGDQEPFPPTSLHTLSSWTYPQTKNPLHTYIHQRPDPKRQYQHEQTDADGSTTNLKPALGDMGKPLGQGQKLNRLAAADDTGSNSASASNCSQWAWQQLPTCTWAWISSLWSKDSVHAVGGTVAWYYKTPVYLLILAVVLLTVRQVWRKYGSS